MFAVIFFLILLAINGFHAVFVPPTPLIEPLYPIGIRMSIPDEPEITLVAYHVKFNDEMVGLEAGTIARDIVRAKKGRWTYHDKTTQLYKGDVLYYWIHVVYRGLGYNLVDQEYVVTDFYDYNGNKIQSNDEGNDNSSNNNNNDSNQNGGPNNNGNGGIDNNGGWNQNNGSGGNNNTNGGNGNDDLNSGQGNSCKLSVTKQTDSSGRTWIPCAGQVLFHDNFQSWQTFHQKQWAHVEQFPNTPDYEFNLYQYSLGNINVDNGLKITPKLLSEEHGEHFVQHGKLTLQQCTGKAGTTDCSQQARGYNILPPVTSSRVNTKNAVNFEYGRVEIKAKLPRGDWIYPLLMLEPIKKDDQTLSSLRIRIGSANGNRELSTFDGRDISGKIVWGGVTGLNWADQIDVRDNEYVASFYNTNLWGDEYHIYEIVWTPGKIVLKVDGRSFYDKQVYLPSNTPFYLTLGVAVGGLSEFPDWSISKGYIKPWRNVEAKALYNFFNSTNTWHNTWKTGNTSLDVEYVKITAL